VNGAEPLSLPHGKPDYGHYADSQVFPVARSIAAAAGWDEGVFVHPKSPRTGRRAADDFAEGQIELGFR
jgi:DNA polymerase-2